jgi:hypothetical protein
MKIKLKKKHLNINLFFGIFWCLFGIVELIFRENIDWFDYGSLVFGIIYLIGFFYQKKHHYLTIQNDILKAHGSFGKSIKLSEIKSIKRFAGDYILKSDKKELTINTQVIEPNSLAELNAELEKLKVKWF